MLHRCTHDFRDRINSLPYDKIGSTPNDALQVCLYSEPYVFNPTCLFEFRHGYVDTRVVKRGTVSGELLRTEHGQP